jgi:hypothetical protein
MPLNPEVQQHLERMRAMPELQPITDPLGYAARTIAQKGSWNWTGPTVLFLQMLEEQDHENPLHFAEFLDSLKGYIDDRLNMGVWG